MLIALLRRLETDAARVSSRRSIARMRAEGFDSFTPPVAVGELADRRESAPQVERMTKSLAETDIVVDLTALEKELMAA